MYLDPSCVMHPIPDDLPVELAVMTNSLANAVEWSVQTPGTRLGDHVVLLGCGQRGLMSVVAAKAAGAKTVVVTGLSHDQHKLKLARQLGADAAVDVQNEALRPIVADVTGGDMADVVVDLTPMDVGSLGVAVEVAADGGCLVIAGLKSGRPTQVDTDVLVRRGLSLRTGLSARSAAFTQAVSLLDGRREAFSRLHTHRFPLDNVVGALDALRGNAPTPAISVVVDTK
ncbi:putative alcohol dehydrogenase Adh [Euzebya pacifica]|uniref:Putative alcohol dehydrogenase Adh n=2 Tax=Euzebya pacifica TaxID=1608957 RepID=A0A346XWR2_9ACTN|nr:putative alcohol dehydrogenase Adh [Euzebya pacifica]